MLDANNARTNDTGTDSNDTGNGTDVVALISLTVPVSPVS
jgi:hypothetical protein